jgi:4,5-dihydroxyphthalate decarboxylase
VRKAACIEAPQDLKGKRVGTTQYGATAIVYLKGMLRDEFGVAPEDMKWFVGGLTAPTEQPLIPLNLPKGVALEFLPEGRTLEGMMAEGELDALFSIYFPKMFLNGDPRIQRLFPNFKSVEQDYYRRTRIFPIMHVLVLRKDVHRAHPFVARSLYRAFCEAKELAVEPLYDTDALLVGLPFLLDHVEESRRVFGKDFWSYGVEANRAALEALCRYVHEQGLAPRRVSIEELFVPVD